MSQHSGFIFPLIAAAGIISSLGAQTDPPKLTARELFYKKPAAAAAEAPPPKAAPKATPRTKQQPPLTSEAKPPSSTHTPNPPARQNLPGGASVIPAAAGSPGPALGLRYSIVRTVNKRPVGEVAASTVFQTGDGIQLKVETNVNGYLYVINQGSSGTWKPMFPSPSIEGGNNRVQAFQPIVLPSGDLQMTFDQHPGEENLFLVFSREPVRDFEELIYSLQEKPKPAAQPQPSSAPGKEKVVMAMANINDSMVGRFRQTYSRDLVIERVTPDTPVDSSARKETAVYVVNPTGAPDSRLVADLKLRHQ